jgi:hypothetical protein
MRGLTPLIVTAFLLSVGAGRANADDRELAKALVGYWKADGFNNDFELKADGTYLRSGFKGEWSIKDGKLVVETFLGKTTNEITLSPDNNKLTWSGDKYTRKK